MKRGIRTLAQDSYRESMIAAHCGLIQVEGRMHDDATDDFKRRYELKSTTKNTNAVSTARDVTINKIDNEWKSKYWIVASGKEFTEGYTKHFVWDQLWISHPKFLNSEFERIKQPLVKRQEIIAHIRGKIQGDLHLKRNLAIVDTIFTRGSTLNDPKLKIAAFKNGGMALHLTDSEQAAAQVREYTSKYPMNNDVSDIGLNQMFKFFEFN